MRRLPSKPQHIQQQEKEERTRLYMKRKFIFGCFSIATCLIVLLYFVLFKSDYAYNVKAKLNDLDCKVTFLDMEYGDSIILECEEKYALIDCGTEMHSDELLNFLKSNDIKNIDYYFISDIREGYSVTFENVLNSLEIGSIILPSNENDNLMHREIDNLAFVNGKNAVVSNQGSGYGLNRMSVSIIDAQPLSLYLKFGENSFVIWNSDDEEKLNEVVKSKPWIDTDVLYLKDSAKVKDAVLETLTPQICIIDCAENSDFDTSYLQGYAEKIYKTDMYGNIVIKSDEVDLEILENQ